MERREHDQRGKGDPYTDPGIKDAKDCGIIVSMKPIENKALMRICRKDLTVPNPPCLYIMDPLWEDNVKKKSIESGKRDIQYKWNVISHELPEIDRKHILQTVQM